ncbi:hypothetical protein LR48_Vigan11g121500 [Vigna angularis]|uniref:Uncharacterized protein n=1 Tax=Phaseolus angularis TaxID=3914 RepID=A0A0L9VSX2_PHAAN|nr:hypothetical protein LR48_Vigan11g121500 [Vigna angularis]
MERSTVGDREVIKKQAVQTEGRQAIKAFQAAKEKEDTLEHVFGRSASQELGCSTSQAFGHSASQIFGRSVSQEFGLRPPNSLGTPGSRTTIHVYGEVLWELVGHRRSFTSTRRFSKNSWATDTHSRRLGGSLGTPKPRTIILIYREVLQELLNRKPRAEEKSPSSEHLQPSGLPFLAIRPYKRGKKFQKGLPSFTARPMAKFKKKTHKAHRSVHR